MGSKKHKPSLIGTKLEKRPGTKAFEIQWSVLQRVGIIIAVSARDTEKCIESKIDFNVLLVFNIRMIYIPNILLYLQGI